MSDTRRRRRELPYEPILRAREGTPVVPLYRPQAVPPQRAQPSRGEGAGDTQQLFAAPAGPSVAYRPPERRRPAHGQHTLPASTDQVHRAPDTAHVGNQDGAPLSADANPLASPCHPNRVAQEVFLVNFSDSIYRPALHGYSLELGLAAAQLCDLVLEHTIQVRDGQIRLAPHCPAADTAAPVAVKAMHDDRSARVDEHGVDRAVGDWIEILAQDACEQVVQPLLAEGVLQRTSPRWWQRNALRFEVTPAGQVATATPRGRLLCAATTTGRDFSLHDAALFALLRVLGLDRAITSESPQHVTTELHAAVSMLARPDPRAHCREPGQFRPPTPAEYTGHALQGVLAALAVLLQREALRR